MELVIAQQDALELCASRVLVSKKRLLNDSYSCIKLLPALLAMSLYHTYYKIVDACNPNPCKNGAACVNGGCQCPSGCSGKYCETCGKCNKTFSQSHMVYHNTRKYDLRQISGWITI